MCQPTLTRSPFRRSSSAPVIAVVVPGSRKADAVLTTLQGPISEVCPATVLRRHSGAKLYLDREAARLVL